MHQFARLALRWNEIEPSPGGQTVRPKPQDARRNGIAPVMIEPTTTGMCPCADRKMREMLSTMMTMPSTAMIGISNGAK